MAISADALQVYEGLETLTGAATADGARAARASPARLRAGRPRASPPASSPALARAEIDAALAAGRRPLVVGGTGLYLQAALTDLELRPPPDPELRARIEARVAARGAEAAHAELAARAPAVAAGIEPGDTTRVIRALELLEMGEEPAPAGEASRLWTARAAPSRPCCAGS